MENAPTGLANTAIVSRAMLSPKSPPTDADQAKNTTQIAEMTPHTAALAMNVDLFIT